MILRLGMNLIHILIGRGKGGKERGGGMVGIGKGENKDDTRICEL